jgi:hypothetical protein
MAENISQGRIFCRRQKVFANNDELVIAAQKRNVLFWYEAFVIQCSLKLNFQTGRPPSGAGRS